MKGGMGRNNAIRWLRRSLQFSAYQQRVILATGRYIGEGFDDARWTHCSSQCDLLAWDLQQYVGDSIDFMKAIRGSRYDYVDACVPVLNRMYESAESVQGGRYTVTRPSGEQGLRLI